MVAGPALVSAKCLAGCYHALDITGPLVAYDLPTIKAIPQAMQRQEIGSAGRAGACPGLAAPSRLAGEAALHSNWGTPAIVEASKSSVPC